MFVILRHAEPRSSELDPELTSFGHQVALEAGAWVQTLLPHAPRVQVWHTPTMRTRQTGEAVVLCLAERAQVGELEALPETTDDLHVLADRLAGGHPGLPTPPLPPVVLVGHHTTLVGLARDLALPSTEVQPRNFCAGLALVRDAASPTGWRVLASHPGRLPG